MSIPTEVATFVATADTEALTALADHITLRRDALARDDTKTSPTPEVARAAFADAQAAYYEAGRRLAKAAADLPELPIDAEADPAWGEDLQVIEPGYERWERLRWSDDHWHGSTCGYDAYGDEGICEYVLTADGYYRMPDHVDWN